MNEVDKYKTLRVALPYIVYMAALMYYGLYSPFCLYDFPLDDAWIHRVYSEAIASGKGFQYNSGIPEAGNTSPLWAIVSSPAHWLDSWGTKAVVMGVKAITIVFGFICIYTIFNLTNLLMKTQWSGTISATLFALEPRFLFSLFSGMETILIVTIWLGAICCYQKKKWGTSLLLFSLTPVSRPESLLILPLCLFFMLLDLKQFSFVKRAALFCASWIPMLLWSLLCKTTTSHWLPNTYYVKAEPIPLSRETLLIGWEIFTSDGYSSLFIFSIGVILFLIRFYKNKNFFLTPLPFFIVVAPVIYFVSVILTRLVRPDGYYWTRWFDPALLMLTVSFCIGYAGLLTYKRPAENPGSVIRKVHLPFVFGLLMLIFSAPSFIQSFQNRVERLASDSRATNIINVQPGKWIYKHTLPDIAIGVNDAGAIRYFGKRKTIDLLGLNNAEIVFKKIKKAEILNETDWLAIFPTRFGGIQDVLTNAFTIEKEFTIPIDEYTICNCPEQTVKTIFKKKKGIRFE